MRPTWQCLQIEKVLAAILYLSIYSSLLQEMGGRLRWNRASSLRIRIRPVVR